MKKKSLFMDLIALVLSVGMLISSIPIIANATSISLNRPLDKAYTITAKEYYSSGAYHGAIDYGCPKNTPVYAAEDGTVTVYDGGYGDGYYGSSDGNGWGNYLDISHGNGYSTRYAHMSTGKFVVKTGDKVLRGQLIGYSGNSGNSTGPHLHFGLYLNGSKVYPEAYITTETGYFTEGCSCSTSCDYIQKVEISESTDYSNTWVNTGNQRVDIVRVAETQLGYTEGTNNNTKYGSWYGLNYNPWCAMFVSWCARQANISTSILKNSAIAGCDSQYFNIPYYDGSSYTPQIGDLFFTKTWSHVGIVRSIEGDYFYTVEGNSNTTGAAEGTSVVSNKRKISDFYFGVPTYVVSESIPASVADLSCDRKIYSTTESICFIWSPVENATNYYVYLWKDGVELFYCDCGTSTAFTQGPSVVGNYTLIVRAGNSAGFSDGTACTFTVTDKAPQEAWIWSNKNNVSIGASVNFNYNAINAEWFVLGVYKSGICYEIVDTGKNDWCTYTFNEPGDYSVYVSTYNIISYSDTPVINISVYDNVPTYTNIIVDKTMYDLTETIKINATTKYANSIYIGISNVNGERIITEEATFPYSISADRLGVGKFNAYFTLSNDFGGIDTNSVEFTIIDSQDYVNIGDSFYAFIENQSSGMYITNQQDNIAGEKPNNELNQIWKFTRINSGAYVIESALDNSCMDVLGYSDALGTNIYAYSEGYKEQTNQQFYIYYRDNAFYFSPVFTEGKNMLDMDLSTYNVTLYNAGDNHEPQKFNIIRTHLWNSGVITQASTCTVTGVKTYTCTVCGDTKTETIEKTNHSYSNTWSTDSTKHWHICTTCNTEKTDQGFHIYDNNCDTVCNTCGYARSITHSWNNGEVTKAATCTVDGVKTYTCTVCGDTKTETISKDVSNHTGNTTVIKNQKTASCITEGYTGDIYWSCCDILYSKGSTIAKTGHTDANQDGKCDTCGYIMTTVESEIIVTSVKANPGANVTIPVNIEQNSGFSYMKVSVSYDASVLTFNGADNGSISTDAFTVSGNNIAWDSAVDASKNGVLVNLKFTVSANANDGEYPVTIKLIESYNALEEEALFSIVPGSITISSIIYGDVNGDGVVNGKDVIRLRKYLVDYDEATESSTVEITGGADCNGDGAINGKDLIRLRKYLVDFDEMTGTSSVVLGK